MQIFYRAKQISFEYTRDLTYFVNLLLEWRQVEEYLVLARSYLRANELGRSENSLRFFREIDSSHRCHVVNIIVAPALIAHIYL